MSHVMKTQPFLEGLDECPENHLKDLVKIKSWIVTQPHLPDISDEYLYLFLHACYYSQDRTKRAIETYFSLKTNTPSLFADRDMEKMKKTLDLAYLARLPKTTPEGYKVLLYAIRDSDYTKMVFSDAVKAFCMFNDVVISDDGLCEGYVVLFDMKGLALGHLARVSLPALRSYMIYIQEAHPVRLKAIHVLNTANYINHIMRLIVPLVRSELLSLIKFHKGNIPEGFSAEIMPIDYGGEAPTIQELDEEGRQLMLKHSSWLKESENLRVDESQRPKKASWWSWFGNSAPSQPLTIEQEKEKFFKNLQID